MYPYKRGMNLLCTFCVFTEVLSLTLSRHSGRSSLSVPRLLAADVAALAPDFSAVTSAVAAVPPAVVETVAASITLWTLSGNRGQSKFN